MPAAHPKNRPGLAAVALTTLLLSLALSGCLGIGSGQNLIGTIGTIFLALGLLPVSRFLREHGAKSSLTHKILIVAGGLLLVG